MKNSKAILGVLLVFLLGGLAGGLIVHRFYQKRIQMVLAGRAPALPPEWIARRMVTQLDLSPAQRTQVLAIIRDTQRQLRQTRQRVEPELRATFREMEQRIQEVLTPEQQAKFTELIAARKARWPWLGAPSPQRQP